MSRSSGSMPNLVHFSASSVLRSSRSKLLPSSYFVLLPADRVHLTFCHTVNLLALCSLKFSSPCLYLRTQGAYSRIALLSLTLPLSIASASVPASTLSAAELRRATRSLMFLTSTVVHPCSVSVSSRLVNISPKIHSSTFQLRETSLVMPTWVHS